MARYKVVIETHVREGKLRAAVAEGPWWLKTAWAAGGGTTQRAFAGLCDVIRDEYPKHTFEFIHAST